MKVALDVPERIVVQELLPEKGTFLNLKRVRMLREALSFTEEENEKFKLRVDGGRILWESSESVELEFSPEMFVLVKNKLLELEKKEELQDRHLGLYEKFVDSEPELAVVPKS